MKPPRQRNAINPELTLAIGLIWGHLSTRQFDAAHKLAQGCLCMWPDDSRLVLMAAYASIEIGHPLDDATRALLQNERGDAWSDLVLRRAQLNAGYEEALQ